MNRVINFLYGEPYPPKTQYRIFHQDSKFDGNDGRTLNKKIVHHIL